MMMKRIGAWIMLLALLTLVDEWHGRCYGCSEEERIGLLEIQSLIDPYRIYFRDWVDGSNCCEWREIECDNTTRRVIQLSLRGEGYPTFSFSDFSDWVLNASLFQPFKELQSLSLTQAGLVGCMENEGFQVLSSKLSNLDLSINQFNDKSILSCFNGNLSTLESLDLSFNELTGGSGSFYGNLLVIYLASKHFLFSFSYHFFSTHLIISFQYALEEHHAGLKVLSSRLKKLENLHLSVNQYNDSIFPSLTGFSSLKSLDLSTNELTGSGFQLQPMRLGKLENLDLSDNQLNSSILSILSGLSSLKSLDLSRNKLIGSINSLQLQPMRLGKLENLDLSFNQLNSSILSILSGLSSLKSLDLSYNKLTGS
ncbi:hypothetical protein D5086_006128, partial [Populus alba]